MIIKKSKIKYHIGIDEVGRGPLAGPVTVCAFAILEKNLKHLELIGAKDSKILSEKKRINVVVNLKKLKKQDLCAYEIASVSPHIIDSKGLTFAINCAIDMVLKKLAIDPTDTEIYLDGGLKAPKEYFNQQTIIKGDGLIPVISCASVLAKVYRDSLMIRYDEKFPGYGFSNHKGYGTLEHYSAINKLGSTEIHRKSFLKKL